MTDDLYSECAPTRQKRKPSECMYFPLKLTRPDRFLAPVEAAHWRSGNRQMVQTNLAKALLRRMGL